MSWIFLLWLGCGTQEQWPTERQATACDAGGLPQGETRIVVKTPERSRYGVVYAPPGPGPHDVIINLHEFRSDPRRQQHYSGWVELAKRENAILVGPDGKSATWNAGTCCGKAAVQNIDDVQFLDALVDRIDETGCTTGRVLATGIGNGGMMASRWACESDKVDGLISVGGALQVEACAGKPIPVLAYHGEADEYYPAAGLPTLKSQESSLALLRGRNQSAGEPVTRTDGDLSCTTWSGTAPVTYCRVAGMKDFWPGAENSTVNSADPLRHAALGGWSWMKEQWAKQD